MTNEQAAKLVRAVQAGEDGAFEALYKALWNTVYGYCYKQLGSKQDAEDVAQEVFLVLHRNLGKLTQPRAFNAVLHKVMYQRCVKHRMAHPEGMSAEELTEETPGLGGEDLLPERLLFEKETREQLALLVEELPEKQREAVKRYYFDGLKQAEIAMLTESDVNAVNNRLVTARRKLREIAADILRGGALGVVFLGRRLKTWVLSASAPVAAAVPTAVAAVVIVGGVTAEQWHKKTAVPPHPEVIPPMTETGETDELTRAIAALGAVGNLTEWQVYAAAHGFTVISWERHGDALYARMAREMGGQVFRAGCYMEGGAFHTAYEVTGLKSAHEQGVRNWYETSAA